MVIGRVLDPNDCWRLFRLKKEFGSNTMRLTTTLAVLFVTTGNMTLTYSTIWDLWGAELLYHEDQRSDPSTPQLGNLQLPITPAPRDRMDLLSLHGHFHTVARTLTLFWGDWCGSGLIWPTPL